MLYTPTLSTSNWTYDNWGTNPSATIGTSITPGTSSAEGSWTGVATSGNITNDVYGIYMQIHSGAVSTNSKPHFVDLGVDTAGGTSYTAVISDIICGASPSLTQAGAREMYFPFYIPAGSAVAVRAQGAHATAGTLRAAIRFYGQLNAPHTFPVGRYSQTFGAGASTLGTSFTPGNAADGSWVSLGTATNPLWWWQLGYNINNGTITAEYTYIELAYGDGSNKTTIQKVMHGGTTAETCGLACQTNLTWLSGYCPVPAGATIYIRGRCNNAPDTGYNGGAIGIGG